MFDSLGYIFEWRLLFWGFNRLIYHLFLGKNLADYAVGCHICLEFLKGSK